MDIQENLARQILMLANTIMNNRAKHLKEWDLTPPQADSMKYFLQNDFSTIKGLKEALGVTHQTAQGLVSRMETKGLITRQQYTADKRYQQIFVTEYGRSLGDKFVANGKRTGSLLLHGMTEEEQKTFVRLLGIAYENIRDDGKNIGDLL